MLPFLSGHFISRYSEENFFIYDKTHRAALLYENGKHHIVQLEHFELPEVDDKEAQYRALWKQFYNKVSIEGRENPCCRRGHMPKRYWENMLEVQDLLKK